MDNKQTDEKPVMSDRDFYSGVAVIGQLMFLAGILILACLCIAAMAS